MCPAQTARPPAGLMSGDRLLERILTPLTRKVAAFSWTTVTLPASISLAPWPPMPSASMHEGRSLEVIGSLLDLVSHLTAFSWTTVLSPLSMSLALGPPGHGESI